jgi:single-stranded DNA-binding protein
MQTITISGYLSRDAEARQTQRGDAVTTWNVPVKQGFGDSERTNWFRVSIWGKRADFAAKARKGDFATVTGDLVIGEYEGKPQYEIRASDFHSVRTAPREMTGGDTFNSSTGNGGPQNSSQRGGFADDLSGDIPFIRHDNVW